MDYTQYIGRGTDQLTGQPRPISYLPNVSEWVDRVYCWETESGDVYSADQVLGGTYGVANAPIQAVANRTFFLRENMSKIAQVINAMQIALGPLLTTIKKLLIQRSSEYNHETEAWLYLGDSPAARQIYNDVAAKPAPDFKIWFSNGTYFANPTIKLTLENAAVYWLKTDGSAISIISVEDALDPEARTNPEG